MPPTMLSVGLDPALVAASATSRAAFPGMDDATVHAGMAASQDGLRRLGLRTDTCFVVYGATAEEVYEPRCATGPTTTS